MLATNRDGTTAAIIAATSRAIGAPQRRSGTLPTQPERPWNEPMPDLSDARRSQMEFERLLRPHFDYLYKLAYRFTGTTDRAEDLVQDLLVRLYPRRGDLAVVEQLRPWLVRVMYHLFIDQTRRAARTPEMPIAETGLPSAETGDPYGDLADNRPGPEMEFELNVNRAHMLRAWEQLSSEHKALLALFEIEGYTLNELESMLDLARGTLKSRLHRARHRLAELLAAEPFLSPERIKDQRG